MAVAISRLDMGGGLGTMQMLLDPGMEVLDPMVFINLKVRALVN